MKTNPYADPTTEKQLAYDAAAAMLAREDDDSLRYAALELRRCIEAIVYEKLEVYDTLLPDGSVHRWQPPRAFDALIAIEPGAEETHAYAVAPEKEFGKISEGAYRAVGVDKRPSAKWIKKTWNKLGSHLHAEWPFARAEKPHTSARTFLKKTLADIAPMARNSFTAMISMNIEFPCAGCGENVRVMEKVVESSRTACCLTCGMPYRAEESDGNFTFIPDLPSFTCHCGASTYVSPQQVKIGYRFSCRSCDQLFHIVGVKWQFAALIDDSSASAEPKEE
jgi:hypothetical protein